MKGEAEGGGGEEESEEDAEECLRACASNIAAKSSDANIWPNTNNTSRHTT